MQDKRLYRVINHVCRLCGGRLLKSDPDREGSLRVRCADCGCFADGKVVNHHIHEQLCMCGAKFPAGAKYALKCGINQLKSIEMPEECVVLPVAPES